MDQKQAVDFCNQWLPAWTGNRPDNLIDFYHEDVFYRDPTASKGITGRRKLLVYFKLLLKRNPDWVWTHDEVFETTNGFTLKWKARIPVGNKIVEEFGLDIVELQDGRIIRNEVFFDLSALRANN